MERAADKITGRIRAGEQLAAVGTPPKLAAQAVSPPVFLHVRGGNPRLSKGVREARITGLPACSGRSRTCRCRPRTVSRFVRG
jgi:hypothetical protein